MDSFTQKYMVDLIRSDLRLLNATLVIPELQQSLRSKGISPKFRSFSYLYNEEQFIGALSNDVVVVKNLPEDLKKARKKIKFPTFSPQRLASPTFYIEEVLPKLKISKVVRLLITDGGCLESVLPSSMVEYQRLRCRVAFHALQLRQEIQILGNHMVARLRAYGRPYLAYHPGLLRDTLAFHGCAELFQDLHTELIQYRRKQMIKRHIVHEELNIDSVARKRNGSCPLMPEEVGLLLRAMGYPQNTIIYLAGSELFGGQRVLIPLRAMYTNLVDRYSLTSKKELSDLVGPEYPLPVSTPQSPAAKSRDQLLEEWNRAGPRPRPLPPPPARPFYAYEHQGWYGWLLETDKEPDPSPADLRMQAHWLLWDALDYYVSVEADAFFPGFHSDGSGWPDFSSLVMGHRVYQEASRRTYRPDRKAISEFFDTIRDNLYHPSHNWTVAVRDHLNRSLSVDGLKAAALQSKPSSFLSHPLPECSCTTTSSPILNLLKDTGGNLIYGKEDKCPQWMDKKLVAVSFNASDSQGEDVEEIESSEESGTKQFESVGPSPEDEEMDPYD
ncbi:uncharacterized protein At1g04910-like isoform X3 [Asparagus officinalis]|uniref:uncharacterized protein At1g04910-like isoform X3 n=1 Tax=Asparagus officinalis TaxID=4686 RepID=UPI00098E4690|nr:uncharacterized protein At1g04910-like isoform X3 [Asparagus officinalis]XP_020254874.1 uncharacterized protein At1g04910-like isoform X3 [Asparagus officinalis]